MTRKGEGSEEGETVPEQQVAGAAPERELTDEVDREVARLLAAGEHAAAAEAYLHSGYPRRAAEVFEQIFEHDRALELYEGLSDVRSAMRVALEARDDEAIDRVIGLATRTGQAPSLLKVLGRAERHYETGKIHLSTGDLEQAAAAFETAHRFLRAATCREEMGDFRAAGVLYERHLEEIPGEPEASLRLGRILGRFSRYDDGLELLQAAIAAATDKASMVARTAPAMILSFLELGYREAASQVLSRWQASGDSAAPESLEGFLTSDRGQALAAQMAAEAQVAERRQEPTGLDAFLDSGAETSPGTGVDNDKQALNAAPLTMTKETGEHDDDDHDDDDHGDDEHDDDEQARGDDATMLLGGRYLLGEPLGGGGVGQVFRAYDALMDRPVAVKIFGSGAMASEAVHSYAREARAAAALDHVAVAPLVEINMAQGFVVTTFVEGDTLEERVRAGGDEAWLMPSITSLLGLLGTCHRIGLVHGALKPTNLFIVTGGLRVVDFGAHHLLALRSTETGGLASVWPYLAPEQLFGAPPDVAADLYAVAAILYRAVTGRPPFARAEDDRRSAPRPASTHMPSLDPAWDALFAQALSPERSERFASAADLASNIPPLPRGFALPPAQNLAGEEAAPVELGAAARYRKGVLVHREGSRLRVYEGVDDTLGRAVWIVEVEAEDDLEPFKTYARIGRGMQPVYDVVPQMLRAVVARDEEARRASLEDARLVPQGLTRDLAALAHALEAIHEAGFAFGGLAHDRLLGPIGPRLRLAPASAAVSADEQTVARDWQDFGRFVAHAFGLEESVGEERESLSLALESMRLLDRAEAAALIAAADLRWPAFLEQLTERLVKSAPGRVMARLAVTVLKG